MLSYNVLFVYLLALTSPDIVVIKPQEIDDVLVNPGMGWTTFHSFNGDKQNENYPRSSIAYFRYYWDVLEPEQGKYEWHLIDDAMAEAKKSGQDFAFRVMPANGTPKTPDWLRKLGCKGKEYYDGKSWMPYYSDPVYLENMGRFVAELGKRYDGNPNLDHLDIGSLGHWGEWHVSRVDMEMPPFEVKKKIIDMYLQAFQKTQLVMLIGDAEGLEYAVSNGTGWRADCLGDMGGFSKTWNHMEFYPEQLKKANATEAWKNAPVVFETCWTMQYWKEQDWDVEFIFSEALKMHASVVNNKSSPVPQEWWHAVNEFSRKMGYRFVLRELSHPKTVKSGQTLNLNMLWENIGVAPCYKHYILAIELRSAQISKIWKSKADLTTWLPGKHTVNEALFLPEDFATGKYKLRIALLGRNTNKPRVKLAIDGMDSDGWYSLSEIEVKD